MIQASSEQKTFHFKKWEKILMGFSVFLFILSSTFYLSGISLRKYLLGWSEEEGKEQVGILGEKQGGIKRQVSGAMEFNLIEKSATLYNYDTLVTSSASSATLALDGGGSIQLGPSTMIRLSFESNLSLQGISRAANIEVVKGTVTGQTKAMPIALKTRDQIISITEKQGENKIEVHSAPWVKPSPAAPSLATVIPLFVPSPKPMPSQKPTPAPSLIPSPHPSPKPSLSPSPTPSPSLIPMIKTQIQFITPKNEAHFQIEKGSQRPEKTIALEWQASPSNTKLQLVVLQQPFGTGVLNKTVSQDSAGRGKFSLALKNPGVFSWELRSMTDGPQASRSKSSRFYIDPEFEGIEILPHLIGGQKTSSNVYQGESLKKFDITLQWKPYPEAREYSVRLYSTPDKKTVLFEQKTTSNEVSFNKEKIIAGNLYYEVSSKLPSGFLVNSVLQEFSFSFLAPHPVVPVNHAVIIKPDFTDANNGLLLTWQKTNFTDGYELEISKDSEFKQLFFHTKTRENFLVIKLLGPGKMWWRVRSLSGKVTSPFSIPNDFEVKQK